MTIVSSIIVQALRETNVIAIGANPTPAEAAEALDRLQSVILSVLGNEVGYVLEDWNVTNATAILKPSSFVQDPTGFFVPMQARLVCNLSVPTTLLLDPQPQDGQRVSVIDAAANFGTHNLTLNGNGRLIESSPTKVLAANGTQIQWVYRADKASWVVVDPLISTSEMPFPEEFDDYFIIMTAMRLNPRYGRPLAAESKLRLDQQTNQMILRYNQSRLREATQMQSPQGGLGAKGS
jgi:hypothetical protein